MGMPSARAGARSSGLAFYPQRSASVSRLHSSRKACAQLLQLGFMFRSFPRARGARMVSISD